MKEEKLQPTPQKYKKRKRILRTVIHQQIGQPRHAEVFKTLHKDIKQL